VRRIVWPGKGVSSLRKDIMSISLSSKDEEMTDLFQGIEIAGNEKVVGRRLPRFQFGPSFWF